MVPESHRIGSAARTSGLFLILNLVAVSQIYCSVNYDVAWEFRPDDEHYWNVTWLQNKTFYVNDTLTFHFTPGYHDVWKLGDKADYIMCNIVAKPGNIRKNFGKDTLILESEGYHYFACGLNGHCANLYLKLKVFANISRDAGNGGSSSLGPIIGAVVGGLLFLALLVAAFCCYRRRRKPDLNRTNRSNGRSRRRSGPTLMPTSVTDLGNDGSRMFTYKELATATKNFNKAELLGRGGFGSVYKGTLKDKSMVAVKAIAEDSRQGESEFLAEVSIIGKIRHRNLVRLRGWCAEKDKLLVVYDHMPNGSLDKWIIPAGKEEKSLPVLGWKTRYEIVCGTAAALAYLHEEYQQCILHRDVKPSNVLLDENFNAYLGDFGMARLIDHNKVAYSTVVAGTMGYLAPELPHTRKATPKTDVFSFGVLCLEVACGRRAFDHNLPHLEVYLLDWVWTMHHNKQIPNCVDARLGSDVDWNQSKLVLHIGLLACHPDPASRPSMRFIRQVLNGDLSLPTLPPARPVISYSWSSAMESTQECISMDILHSGNSTDVTDSLRGIDHTDPNSRFT